METVQPSSSNVVGGNANEIQTLENNESPNEISEAEEERQQIMQGTVDFSLIVKVANFIHTNDWKGLEDYILNNALEAIITSFIPGSTFTNLHMLAQSDVPPRLLEMLLSKIPPESLLQLTILKGESPFACAAKFGRTKFLEIFVRRNKDLPNIRSPSHSLPIHDAAICGCKETVRYLLTVTTLPLDGADGINLLKYLVSCNLLPDIALELLKKYPKIARGKPEDTRSILELLASRPEAFASGSRHGYWEHLLYQWIPVQEEFTVREEYNPRTHLENLDKDVENPNATSKMSFAKFLLQQIASAFGSLGQKSKIKFWNTLMQLAPSMKSIHDEKKTHEQTLQVVKILCAGAADSWTKYEDPALSFGEPSFMAASRGIQEIVDEIVKSFSPSIFFINEQQDILDVAIQHRQEKVFNFMYKVKQWRYGVANLNFKTNNVLHLAGKLVPSSEVPGPALQMQRELQWFKAAENTYHPSFQVQLNHENKTPREVFTEEHKGLVKDGEKWMKDSAQSCSVVGALIITVAFAAAFTVPGGSDDKGMPNYLHDASFIIFGISDALALFSSTTSVLMFLGILTSRYSEEDFLKSLPTKLIIGLLALFFSIASMMVAFAATAYIVVFHPWKWVLIPMGLLGFLPVTFFASLQFPLLLEMYSSTYGPGIFHPVN